ncbi:exopolysaccharide biosynthesis protein [Sulfitobacter sp. S0837]|uniref:exopolysaccharide biosynthesis protein n=1 Tax=Sulfitobacter maritimus TaxID=2741719 RepID=UPI001583CB72|nr:exopolysaccharide biosynthesis protein [Sulfitobacter maritimus]NUH64700.1 exopolysaccharide biosynthesis protein [Sulfitobacter maritimus]
MNDDTGALTEVIEELKEASEGQNRVKVGALVDALDERGYGPALAVLPLTELTPVGGVPGYPTLLALTLATIVIRLLLGYEHFWLPNWLRRRTLKSDHVIKAVEWLKPVSNWIDSKLHKRLAPIAGRMGQRIACFVILGILLIVPPLEFVPFATSAPMIAVSIFGLGLLYRDGLLMLLGFVGAAAAVWFGLSMYLGTGTG